MSTMKMSLYWRQSELIMQEIMPHVSLIDGQSRHRSQGCVSRVCNQGGVGLLLVLRHFLSHVLISLNGASGSHKSRLTRPGE